MIDTTKNHEILRQRWHSLNCDLPDALFDDLAVRHAEPQRHYHTFDHIADCFEKLDACRADKSGQGEIAQHCGASFELAIFYHDAIYDPQRTDNEQQSAQLALAQLAPYREQIDLFEVELLIQATAHFSDQTPQDLEPDEALIINIDLSILGSDPARYDAYADGIRNEYQHVSDQEYRLGRSAVLKSFLLQKNLFHTEWFQLRYSSLAIENIHRELERLGEP